MPSRYITASVRPIRARFSDLSGHLGRAVFHLRALKKLFVKMVFKFYVVANDFFCTGLIVVANENNLFVCDNLKPIGEYSIDY